jgi:hypothetical protein
MTKIKQAYYYFFYIIYKSIEYTSELAGGKFYTAFKTSVVMIALEFWFTITLLNYYNIFVDRNIHFPKVIYIAIALFFSILSYITIDHNDTWKKYNSEFSKLPNSSKNNIGKIMVWGIVLFIVINFIYSIYLMSLIDWSQYNR